MEKETLTPPIFDKEEVENLVKGWSSIPAFVRPLINSTSGENTIPWDTGRPSPDSTDPWYHAEIKWAENCTGPPQNVGWPMELYSAGEIIRDIFLKKQDGFDQCKSGNNLNMIGRAMQYGCVVYRAWCDGCDQY